MSVAFQFRAHQVALVVQLGPDGAQSTYRGAGTLTEVLGAYCKLDPPEGGWKLVIVDSGSTNSKRNSSHCWPRPATSGGAGSPITGPPLDQHYESLPRGMRSLFEELGIAA